MSQDKMGNFMWACGLLREEVDKGTYGTVVISMQGGNIGVAKVEVAHKPTIEKYENPPPPPAPPPPRIIHEGIRVVAPKPR